MKLKRNLLFMALASATLMVSVGVHAQTAVQADDATLSAKEREAKRKAQAAEKAKELDVVEVTGIRRGIESAINMKQESTSIIEAVSAEDIGKLPDTSIAESISRLPGLASQRVAGRATTISIRGLAGDFSTTLLNGREQVSSGDNRGVEFDQYPSELLSSVVVYKTPDAGLVAQGISGTVDLNTVRPLAFGKQVVSLNARYEKNSVGELNSDSDDTGYRISASYIDQFADDTVGIAIGFARLDSPGQTERWNAWGYESQTVAGQAGTEFLTGSQLYASSNSNVRDGLMAVVEWAPSDSYSGALDIYYSKYERVETTRGLEVGLFPAWTGSTLSNPVVDNGLLVNGTFTGIRPVLRNDKNTRDDDIFAIGFKNEFTFNDYWSGMADVSMSKADRSERILETYAGAAGRDNVNVTVDRNGFPTFDFGLDYTDPATIQLRDPGGWGQDGYVKYPEFDDELRSARFSLTRGFDSAVFSSIDFGSNWSNREKSRAVAEAFVDLLNNRAPAPVPGDSLVSPVDMGFAGFPGVISYNVGDVFRNAYRTRTSLHPDILNKDWEVEEDVITTYAKINIDALLGSVPVRGNIGFSYVNADQESRGFAVPGGNASGAQPFAGGAEYNDFLPSLNLIFSLTDEHTLRFGAAKQMARPRMDQMRANNGFGIDTTRQEWSGGGGNPELEPWRATSYDLSWEYYLFGNKGYISAAAFHKDLNDYIYDQTVEFDFSVFDLSGFTANVPASPIGRFTRPTNGEGGSINGWEFAFSVPFGEMAEFLDGFGILGSYSDTRSSVKPLGPGTSQPLPGLSRYVSNLTAYYEKHGFSTRISQRSRSTFIGEIQGFGADRETRYIDGEKIVDFQMGYDFGGDWDGLSVILQVNNLTNEEYQEFFRDAGRADRPRSFNEYGRTYLLGATYRF